MSVVTTTPSDPSAVEGAWSDAPAHRRQRRLPHPALATLLLLDLLALVPLVLTLVTPRFFQGQYARDASAIATAFLANNRPWATYAGQGAVLLLVVCLVLVVALAVRERRRPNLFVLAGALYVLSFLASSQWSANPGGTWQIASMPLVVLVAAIAPVPKGRDVQRHALGVLVVYAAGSLVAAVLLPDVAVERHYIDGILPWPDVRLHGVTPHANSLGAICAVALALHLLVPSTGSRRSRWSITAILLAALVLSQSKTTLVALVLVLAVCLLLPRLGGRRLGQGSVAAVSAVAVGLPFLAGPGLNEFLTGRVDVWRITLDSWRANPVFGHGLGLWDYEMKLAYLPTLRWTPGQAHNEVAQTLGQLGLLGALALTVLMVALARRVSRVGPQILPVLVGLILLLVVRGTTETALGRSAPEIGPFLLLITMLFARQDEAEARPLVPAPRRPEADRPPGRLWTVVTGSVLAIVVFSGGVFAAGGAPIAGGDTLVKDLRIQEEMFGTHLLRLTRTPRTPWPSTPTSAIRIWDTGTTWADIEPQQGTFVFEKLDQQVALAEQHGAKVLMTLGMTPNWASPRKTEPSPYGAGAAAPPTEYKAWRAYVRALATRYQGRIEAYEVWNEPIEKKYYSGTPEQLADLTRETKLVLEATDPEALVVSPAPYWGTDTQEFLQRYLDAGVRKFIDVVGIHLYARQPELLVPIMKRMQGLLLSQGLGDKPVWNTETGYGYRVPQPYTTEQARGMVARSFLLASANGVARFYWYAWDDRKWVKLFLVEEDLTTPTPAGRALLETQRLLIGSVNRGCTENASNGVWTCRLSRDDRDSLVLWQPKQATTVELPQGATAVRKLDGSALPLAPLALGPEPVIVDLAADS